MTFVTSYVSTSYANAASYISVADSFARYAGRPYASYVNCCQFLPVMAVMSIKPVMPVMPVMLLMPIIPFMSVLPVTSGYASHSSCYQIC